MRARLGVRWRRSGGCVGVVERAAQTARVAAIASAVAAMVTMMRPRLLPAGWGAATGGLAPESGSRRRVGGDETGSRGVQWPRHHACTHDTTSQSAPHQGWSLDYIHTYNPHSLPPATAFARDRKSNRGRVHAPKDVATVWHADPTNAARTYLPVGARGHLVYPRQRQGQRQHASACGACLGAPRCAATGLLNTRGEATAVERALL